MTQPSSHTHEPIVQDGEPVLRAEAKALTPQDITSPATCALIAHMKELLAQEKNGVGLAAPQVGSSLRLFIVAGRVFLPEREEGEKPVPAHKIPADKVFINPEIMRQSKRMSSMDEGCLSVRGLYGTVVRSEKVTIRAIDEKGKSFTMNASGLVAQIFQHEVDHLNGILYIDRAISTRPDKDKK